MTAVLRSPSHLPSSPSSSFSCGSGDGSLQAQALLSPEPPAAVEGGDGGDLDASAENKGRRRGGGGGRGRREEERRREEEEDEQQQQLSLLALLVTAVRKSLVGCRTESDEDLRSMEIGWPTNVRHIAHVTFDRFHGFLGLPVEFEPEVPRRAPSASTSVFGVSTESMQCSYDCRGNSIPTILILMQRRLYEQGGLQAEGIFRINAENSQEEHVRDQLNSGIVPDGIDVHCLAGLIKAWFRELPTGVLDSLTPEQVMQCQTEEECIQLVKLLPPTEAGLLDWAVNLMADVVQEELHNKMNARNVAMVFAPNMTQMADPLTALMYAVQVMNFLKTLILKTLKERQESNSEAASASHVDPSDENGHNNPCLRAGPHEEEKPEQVFLLDEPVLDDPCHLPEDDSTAVDTVDSSQSSQEKATVEQTSHSANEQPCEVPMATYSSTSNSETAPSGCSAALHVNSQTTRRGKTNYLNCDKGTKKIDVPSFVRISLPAEKSKDISILSRINSKVERIEAWR